MTRWAPRRRATTVVSLSVTAVMTAFLAWLTLSPQRLEQRLPEGVEAAREFIATSFGPQFATIGWMDRFANIAVFIAVGVLAYLIIPRRAWFVALLVAPVASALVELVQAVALPDRVSDPGDVVSAALGGAIGVSVAALCTALTARRRSSEGSA